MLNEAKNLLVNTNAVRDAAQINNSKQRYWKYPPPYFLLTVSVFELVIFSVSTKDITESLRFDPNKQFEVWRFLTYMLLHKNCIHVFLNVVTQCLFAVVLEKIQGNLKIGILYFGSGIVGALMSACVRPDVVVGASAGVYALLISYLSHIVINFNSSKYKIWICSGVTIIVTSDIIYYFLYVRNSANVVISEGAHFGGAISGFLLGLILYSNADTDSTTTRRNKIIFWVAIILFVSACVTTLTVDIQIRKCTPDDMINTKFVYIC